MAVGAVISWGNRERVADNTAVRLQSGKWLIGVAERRGIGALCAVLTGYCPLKTVVGQLKLR